MRCHIIIKNVRSSTEQLEYSFRSKLKGLPNYFFREFWNFLWFLLYHNFVPENFNSLHMEKNCCLFPLPFDKIIFPRNADLYPAYKHDNQTRGGFCLVCATGPFHWARGFSEKRVKCFWRIVGPARRLTLPLQKGDWTRWVSLPAEPTFGKLPLMRPALGHKILVVI